MADEEKAREEGLPTTEECWTDPDPDGTITRWTVEVRFTLPSPRPMIVYRLDDEGGRAGPP